MQDKMIRGGKQLNGTVNVQGAKNAALPAMVASILLRGQTLVLEKVPDLYDIQTMSDLLTSLGAKVTFKSNVMTIQVPEELTSEKTPTDLVRKMRACLLFWGLWWHVKGNAVLPLPGGCVLGSRPIDFHLKGLTKWGHL